MTTTTPDPRRWLILGTVGLAQLMVVLDVTIVNIALPSAQRDLGFSTADRQWVVTAYALAFGSLLLLGGRLGDLIGRKITFLAGAIGFAAASAVGVCLVYGFSNAATHNWHVPSTYGFLAAGVALLAAFVRWQFRATNPLLPPRVVLDRNRGAAYLAVLITGAGMFGIFLFLIYYLQQTLHYSPVVSGVAFLPLIAMVVVSANLSNVVLLPRFGPKPLVTVGMLLAAGSLVWLTRIGVHSSYASAVLGPLMTAGLGFGFTIAPSMNTGTFGVAPQDAGVASATLNTGQQIGGSIGTSLLNTIFASAVARYLASHLTPATVVHGHPAPSLTGMALIHGYTTGFWVAAAIFGAGAVICGALFRSGPLRARTAAAPSAAAARRATTASAV